ncbi:hypothetical protein [Nocardia sp. NPDC051832]|uniref:hypothetical protein n=1 Tax=Nocardia sp. NPDC051832 TaxID=3155673 RepID=UPI00341BDE9F
MSEDWLSAAIANHDAVKADEHDRLMGWGKYHPDAIQAAAEAEERAAAARARVVASNKDWLEGKVEAHRRAMMPAAEREALESAEAVKAAEDERYRRWRVSHPNGY